MRQYHCSTVEPRGTLSIEGKQVDGDVYLDCARDKDGEPIRGQQLKRLKENRCVYCGVLASEEHECECPEKWEKELSQYGLSEKQITREDARKLARAKNKEGEDLEATADPELTGSVLLRSWRERNFAKKDIPKWARNDSGLLVLMQNYDMRRKTARQIYQAVQKKWRTNQKIRASGKQHARLRKCLERLRKDAESLKQELVATGLTPGQADAYLADPTLKRLLYPEKINPIYDNYPEYAERMEKIVGGADWDSLSLEQKQGAREWMEGLVLEAQRRALENMPDRDPERDPSPSKLAKFLDLTPRK